MNFLCLTRRRAIMAAAFPSNCCTSSVLSSSFFAAASSSASAFAGSGPVAVCLTTATATTTSSTYCHSHSQQRRQGSGLTTTTSPIQAQPEAKNKNSTIHTKPRPRATMKSTNKSTTKNKTSSSSSSSSSTPPSPDPLSLPILALLQGFRESKVMFAAVQLGVFDALSILPTTATATATETETETESAVGSTTTPSSPSPESDVSAGGSPGHIGNIRMSTTSPRLMVPIPIFATAEQLASQLHLPVHSLRQLLDACVALQLLVRASGTERLESERHNKTTQKKAANKTKKKREDDAMKEEEGSQLAAYSLTPMALKYLVSSSSFSFAGYVAHSNKVLLPLWQHLETAVIQGYNVWQQAFGWDSSKVFQNLYNTEASRRRFLSGMHSFGVTASPLVASAFDLAPFRHACDLGGGTGHLGRALVERWPEIVVTVYDLQEVIDEVTAAGYLDRTMAPSCTAAMTTASNPSTFFSRDRPSSRLRSRCGNFFDSPLPTTVDLFVLSRILHDWTETKIDMILRKICDALPVNGGVLIAETVLNDDKTGPPYSALSSLNMLVQTEGRERSAAEYAVLLQRIGFVGVQVKRTGTVLDAILARKAAPRVSDVVVPLPLRAGQGGDNVS